MKRSIWVAAALVLSLFSGVAHADHLNVSDPSDAKGLLDVKRVSNSGGWSPTWRIDTYNAWSRKSILDKGFITVYLDTFGSDRHDYFALIWADKDRVRATLMRDRQEKDDYQVRGLRIRRPTDKSAKVTVGLRNLRLSDDRATYNWYVQTLWSWNECWNVCFDWAPNIGKNGDGIEEPLPLSG